MRKVVASLFISLDGEVASPDQWQFDAFDEDMMMEMSTQLDAQDTVLLGRVTYEEWSAYWPTSSDEPFATFINNIPKLVASTTLDSAVWGKFDTVKLVEGDLKEAITRLKQQPGKNISVTGSITLIRWLLQNDLLDELHLQVHPVIAGSGRRLFEGEGNVKRLKLVDNRTTSTGVIMLTYQPYTQPA